MYLRLVRPNRLPFQKARAGFFDAAYELRDVKTLDKITSDQLEDHLDWFRANLRVPKVFSRSKSKGRDRNETPPGLSWFKPEAQEMLQRAFDLAIMLNGQGFAIEILRTERVGYVIYEDQHQVVAEPFADTPV